MTALPRLARFLVAGLLFTSGGVTFEGLEVRRRAG
jgi:hypothetical protein